MTEMIDTPVKGKDKMRRNIKVFTLSIFMLSVAVTQSRAGLVLSLSDVTIGPGNIGTMDISITSSSNDTLSGFGLELLITPNPSATSLLQFTATQPNPTVNPNYVFAGASFNQDNNLPFWGLPTMTKYAFDTISGGDFDDSTLGYVTIPSTPGDLNSYLTSVQFQAAPGATAGDQFQISLVNDPNFTYFDDQNGNPLSLDSISGGSVTISPTAAAPEPSSLAMFLSGITCVVWFKSCRSR